MHLGARSLSLANTVGTYQPFRYRGYVYDTETQWYYLQSRYYAPNTCRFISADVLLSTGQGVIGHNSFAYCGNNPIIRGDDEGDFWHILAGAAIGAVIGAVSSIVSQAVSGQEINWGAVAVSAAAGAVSGAINAACPCMGVLATGLVQGAIGAAAHAGTELAYGRKPTVEGTLKAGIISGVFAAGAKFVAQSTGLTACFVAGTQVLTSSGPVSIENINEGDYVYATDPETGESGYKRVVQTFERETDEIVKVTVDGETITTTPKHPFYVPENGWTEAIHLRAGDILVTSNGEYVIIEKIQHEILESPIKVYNFEVEGFHTYYVASDACPEFVLVHNECKQPDNLSPAGAGRRGAFNAAKRDLGIPKSQQPIRILPNTNLQNKIVPGRVYDFGNGLYIRDDVIGHIFKDGGVISRHFNTSMGGHYFY